MMITTHKMYGETKDELIDMVRDDERKDK